MTVVVPFDYEQTILAVIQAFDYPGPVYLRLAREPTPLITKKEQSFEIGKAQTLLKGKDITLISCGPLLYQVIMAAQRAKQKGVSCEVINLHTIKPLDKDTVCRSARLTGKIITIEDHQVQGGVGSAVAEAIAASCPCKIRMMGLDNQFAKTAPSYGELLELFGLSSKHIYQEIMSMVKTL